MKCSVVSKVGTGKPCKNEATQYMDLSNGRHYYCDECAADSRIISLALNYSRELLLTRDPNAFVLDPLPQYTIDIEK